MTIKSAFSFLWRSGSKIVQKRFVQTIETARQAQSLIVIWLGTIVVALIAVLLAYLTDRGFKLFSLVVQHYNWSALIIMPFACMLIYYVLARWAPGALGGGIPQTKLAIRQVESPNLVSKFMAIPVVIAKFLAVTCALSFGIVLGRQGPTVQMGAAFMYSLRRYLRENTPQMHRQLILAGAAAGIAAAFNTPLAGIVFALEELSSTIEEKSSGVVISAVIFSGMIAQSLLGDFFFFGRVQVPDWPFWDSFFRIGLLALSGGLIGGAFVWLALHPERWVPSLLITMRQRFPLLFVGLCGLLVAVLGLWMPIYGSGTNEVAHAFHTAEPLPSGYAVTKWFAMLLSFLTSVSGGVFAPALAVGAGVGSAFSSWMPDIPLAALMALGMVSVLAAITRAPLTSAIIVMEMVDGHHMLMMILLAAFIGSLGARVYRCHLYEILVARLLEQSGNRSSHTELIEK